MARSTAEPTPVFGVSWWNRPQVRDMAGRPVAAIRDVGGLTEAAEAGGEVMVWASREPSHLADAAAAGGGRIIRIEDGFVRSPGLGAHFSPAYSLIFDDVGVYYDATRPSGLERLLAGHAFDGDLLDRAARIRERLLAAAISKYAVGRGADPDTPAGRTRVLVVGQVEDDASIRLGGADVRTNLALLERARAQHPAGFLAYKPHPDVERAGRPGRVAPEAALRFADAVWPDIPIATALDWAEAVHVISSLAGFEALLRGRAAHVHGLPFFAGWSLTIDHAAQPARRGRPLALDALVAATLVLYPRYLDPVARRPIEIEGLLDRFEAGWTDPLIGRPYWHRVAAALKRRLGPLRQRF